MSKVIDYTIICDDELYGLMTKVRKSIEVGWTPVGGVTKVDSLYGDYIQAMVRYEEIK